MTKEQLQEKTVAELRELVAKANIPGRSAWTTKDEFIAALADDSPTAEQKQAKARESGATPDYPTEHPLGVMTIKGEGKANAVGLFQTSPDVKEYLTAAEAREKGFYVAPTETAETTKSKKR